MPPFRVAASASRKVSGVPTVSNTKSAPRPAVSARIASTVFGGDSRRSVAPKVRAFYEAYFDLIAEGISASTADGYRTVINRYVLKRFGEMRLSEITAGVVNVWLREVKKARREEGKKRRAGSRPKGAVLKTHI